MSHFAAAAGRRKHSRRGEASSSTLSAPHFFPFGQASALSLPTRFALGANNNDTPRRTTNQNGLPLDGKASASTAAVTKLNVRQADAERFDRLYSSNQTPIGREVAPRALAFAPAANGDARCSSLSSCSSRPFILVRAKGRIYRTDQRGPSGKSTCAGNGGAFSKTCRHKAFHTDRCHLNERGGTKLRFRFTDDSLVWNNNDDSKPNNEKKPKNSSNKKKTTKPWKPPTPIVAQAKTRMIYIPKASGPRNVGWTISTAATSSQQQVAPVTPFHLRLNAIVTPTQLQSQWLTMQPPPSTQQYSDYDLAKLLPIALHSPRHDAEWYKRGIPPLPAELDPTASPTHTVATVAAAPAVPTPSPLFSTTQDIPPYVDCNSMSKAAARAEDKLSICIAQDSSSSTSSSLRKFRRTTKTNTTTTKKTASYLCNNKPAPPNRAPPRAISRPQSMSLPLLPLLPRPPSCLNQKNGSQVCTGKESETVALSVTSKKGATATTTINTNNKDALADNIDNAIKLLESSRLFLKLLDRDEGDSSDSKTFGRDSIYKCKNIDENKANGGIQRMEDKNKCVDTDEGGGVQTPFFSSTYPPRLITPVTDILSTHHQGSNYVQGRKQQGIEKQYHPEQRPVKLRRIDVENCGRCSVAWQLKEGVLDNTDNNSDSKLLSAGSNSSSTTIKVTATTTSMKPEHNGTYTFRKQPNPSRRKRKKDDEEKAIKAMKNGRFLHILPRPPVVEPPPTTQVPQPAQRRKK